MASRITSPLTAPLLALALGLACNGDDGSGASSETGTGSSTGDASSTSTSSTGDASSTSAETTTTGGNEACEAVEPFALNIANDPDTYATCEVPFEFFAKRRAGTVTVERCGDNNCSSCDPNLAYDLDFGSSTVVPEETCLRIAHETRDVAGVCRTRGSVIWRLDQPTSPLVVMTALTPEPPATLDPATLTTKAVGARACTCDAGDAWCCDGEITGYAIEFTVEGEAPVQVEPGLANFKNLSYAGAKYEAVVTQAYEAAGCGVGLTTGWYLRRI
ncbi:MAG: hypothetical protein KC420_11730 [Myxococcales bacterium]|nr:hypothetical protein [Myxococcales bacterium]